MSTLTEISQRNHRRAVRFFWGLLIGATTVSLVGNIAHAVLPYLPHLVVLIGAATVPPIALLAAVHGKHADDFFRGCVDGFRQNGD